MYPSEGRFAAQDLRHRLLTAEPPPRPVCVWWLKWHRDRVSSKLFALRFTLFICLSSTPHNLLNVQHREAARTPSGVYCSEVQNSNTPVVLFEFPVTPNLGNSTVACYITN